MTQTIMLSGHKDWDRLHEWYGDGTGTAVVKLDDDPKKAFVQLAKETANRLKYQQLYSEQLNFSAKQTKEQIDYIRLHVDQRHPLRDIGEYYLAAGWLWERYEDWLWKYADSNECFKCDNTISGTGELMTRIIDSAWDGAQAIINRPNAEFFEY